MKGARRLICVICMILILIFAIIHLGVSISILVKFRDYGDVFRPERGLAGFNIVISILGFIIAGFGLFAVLTDRGNLSTVVAFAAIILAVFTFASLIAALAINSLAIEYVSSRFSNQMNNYKTDQNSRDIVNRIQTNYDCCGTNTWLDWTGVSLNATGSSTSSAATPARTTNGGRLTITTTETGGGATTTPEHGGATTTPEHGGATTTPEHGGATTTPEGGGATTTPESGGGGGGGGATTTPEAGGATTTAEESGGGGATTTTETIGDVTTNPDHHSGATGSSAREKDAELKLFSNSRKTTDKSLLSWEGITNFLKSKRTPQGALRRRRQAQSGYGGIYGLPLSFRVTLPQSCCTNDLSTVQDLSNLYCISNANNVSNNFHTDGCAKQLGKRSVGQTLGITVINSFLVMLALAAIPALIETDPYEVSPQNGFINQSAQQYQPAQQYQSVQQYQPAHQYAYGGTGAPAYYPEMSYNTYNPAYVAYY